MKIKKSSKVYQIAELSGKLPEECEINICMFTAAFFGGLFVFLISLFIAFMCGTIVGDWIKWIIDMVISHRFIAPINEYTPALLFSIVVLFVVGALLFTLYEKKVKPGGIDFENSYPIMMLRSWREKTCFKVNIEE